MPLSLPLQSVLLAKFQPSLLWVGRGYHIASEAAIINVCPLDALLNKNSLRNCPPRPPTSPTTEESKLQTKTTCYTTGGEKEGMHSQKQNWSGMAMGSVVQTSTQHNILYWLINASTKTHVAQCIRAIVWGTAVSHDEAV